ncbi:signal peptidase II [Actinomadura harenae]|uniref:Lipoprotein signal peptidase n=1 Tax=Actinomadura harenae TaxID=2483351 RepID=A0A3M2LDW8_9ACTN|nr:signal peptidase II [Actinomadura harenae]RMI34803.1 signal peptidase II [Actinomadura harenae]
MTAASTPAGSPETRGAPLSDERGAGPTPQEDEGGTRREDEGRARPRRIGVLVAVAAAALAVDIVSKALVVSRLTDLDTVRLLGGLLTLRQTRNSGAAFSIGTGYTIVFTTIALGVVVAIVRTARNLRSLPWAICLGLMLGGALGNLTDRVFRAPAMFKGHVVDWIEVPHWPVFNLADSAICCGGVLAVVLAARGLQVDGTRVGDDEKDDDGDDAAKAGDTVKAEGSPKAEGSVKTQGDDAKAGDGERDGKEGTA